MHWWPILVWFCFSPVLVFFFCFCSALPRGLHCDGDLVVESDGCGDVVDDYDTARKAFVSLAASWMALMNNWESDAKFNKYSYLLFCFICVGVMSLIFVGC